MFNNNGCGNDMFLLLILLCCCGNNGGCNDRGRGGDDCRGHRGGNDCFDIIIWLILLSCICGGGNRGGFFGR
ncbi:MAG: chorion class high-cysteine HCB protein 13 [Firmicutes bacterium]|nr:chorion class high-cysteine HCB protein 13 [Bacillota bacterium]